MVFESKSHQRMGKERSNKGIFFLSHVLCYKTVVVLVALNGVPRRKVSGKNFWMNRGRHFFHSFMTPSNASEATRRFLRS